MPPCQQGVRKMTANCSPRHCWTLGWWNLGMCFFFRGCCGWSLLWWGLLVVLNADVLNWSCTILTTVGKLKFHFVVDRDECNMQGDARQTFNTTVLLYMHWSVFFQHTYCTLCVMNKYISSIYTSLIYKQRPFSVNYCQLWHTAMSNARMQKGAMLASLGLGIPTCHSSLFPQNILSSRESSQNLTQLW